MSVGAVAGMMLAQPFDAVTFVAPLYGLVVGRWAAPRLGGASAVDGPPPSGREWRPQLEAISRILPERRPDRPTFRLPRRPCAWLCIGSLACRPGHGPARATSMSWSPSTNSSAALRRATEATLVELESPSIAARKAAVSERLAAAVTELAVDRHPASVHEIAARETDERVERPGRPASVRPRPPGRWSGAGGPCPRPSPRRAG